MDKDVAVALLARAKSVDDTIAKMYSEVEKIKNDDVKSLFNKVVGNLMGYIARNLIFAIEHMYQDLISHD